MDGAASPGPPGTNSPALGRGRTVHRPGRLGHPTKALHERPPTTLGLWHDELLARDREHALPRAASLASSASSSPDVDEGSLTARMPVDQRTHQPTGVLHGGASVALAGDPFASWAATFTVDHREASCRRHGDQRQPPTGGDLRVVTGVAHAGARATHPGVEVRITDEAGSLVCISGAPWRSSRGPPERRLVVAARHDHPRPGGRRRRHHRCAATEPVPRRGPSTRATGVAIAIIAYLWFLADLASWRPSGRRPLVTAIDHGPVGPVGSAVLVDLMLGAVRDSSLVMARDSAKRVVTAIVPAALERSTYVPARTPCSASCSGSGTPSRAIVDVTAQPWRTLLWVGYALVVDRRRIDLHDRPRRLLRLRQVATAPGRYRQPTFRERWFYAWVRHPLMSGLLMAVDHAHAQPRTCALRRASMAYIVVGLRLEERDRAATTASMPRMPRVPRSSAAEAGRALPVAHGRDG